MKKILVGLAAATIVSVVGMPPVALADGQEPGGPHCGAVQALPIPPQVPLNPGCGHG